MASLRELQPYIDFKIKLWWKGEAATFLLHDFGFYDEVGQVYNFYRAQRAHVAKDSDSLLFTLGM